MDEKSQVPALDRTQPSLPLKPGRAGTTTHDYQRNGTTTLFAALDALTGNVIGKCFDRHRHEEFLRFLRLIDTQVPRRLQVHMILDNSGTHTHPDVQAWLTKHPRFHLHFTPTSSSWLNMVGRVLRRHHRQCHPPRRSTASTTSSRPSKNTSAFATTTRTIRLERHRRGHPGQGSPCTQAQLTV